MRQRLAAFLMAFCAVALIQGCASTQPAGRIATAGDARVQADVMRTIGMYESAMGGSPSPRLLAANPVSVQGKTVVEKWEVESKGQRVVYQVTLKPAPTGGVTFGVARMGP